MAESTDNGEQLSASKLAALADRAPGAFGGMLDIASVMKAQMERFDADMNRVKTLAEDQQFAVDDETGKLMIKAVDTYLNKWKRIKGHADQLKRGLPLGSDPYAKQVTVFTAEVATDALGKMDLFEKSLEAFVESLHIARKNYAKMEDHAVQQFTMPEAH